MRYHNLFPALPDSSRIWIFATSATVSPAAQQKLRSLLCTFFESWLSHGRPADGDAVVLDDRFLVAAGTLRSGGPLSGCSMDSLTHAVEEAAQQLDISFLSPLMVFYRDGAGSIQSVSRGTFRQLVKRRQIQEYTPVFDLSISTLAALRNGSFEKAFCRSWHARVFRQRSTVAA